MTGFQSGRSQTVAASATLGIAATAIPLTRIDFFALNGFGLVDGSAYQIQM